MEDTSINWYSNTVCEDTKGYKMYICMFNLSDTDPHSEEQKES